MLRHPAPNATDILPRAMKLTPKRIVVEDPLAHFLPLFILDYTPEDIMLASSALCGAVLTM